MKLLEKFTLVLYSMIMLVLSIVVATLIFGWIDLESISTAISNLITYEPQNHILLGISVLFILLSIKSIFFGTKDERASKDGVLLENDNGRLSISKDTLENLVTNIAKGFDGVENINARVGLDKENNLKVYVTLYVHPNVVIKDLTVNLQKRIKEAIQKTSDLEAKEVNVRIRNITPIKDTTEA